MPHERLIEVVLSDEDLSIIKAAMNSYANNTCRGERPGGKRRRQWELALAKIEAAHADLTAEPAYGPVLTMAERLQMLAERFNGPPPDRNTP